MLLVIDTNVLVSAFLSPFGVPSQVVNLLFGNEFKLCYDSRIITEYIAVLSRPKFSIDATALSAVIDYITSEGFSVIPPDSEIPFVDEDDKKFYEVATFCKAPLVTGNIKHFPKERLIMTPSEFLREYRGNDNGVG